MNNENIAMENEALENAETVVTAEVTEAAEAVEAAEDLASETAETAEPAAETEEEIEEPILMPFLEEEEEETQEEEEYTPKAVAYQETVGAEEPEKTPEQLKLEEEIDNEKFIRDEIAWMFERKLFNVPAWFSLMFIFGAFPAMFTGTYLLKIMGGANLNMIKPELTGLSIVVVAFLQVVFAILCFIAMRRIVVCARNSGGNMSVSGFTMLRTVVLLMCAEPVMVFLDLPGAASGIICTVSLIFLLIVFISITKVRTSLLKSKVKMVPALCGVMFFVMAAMHAAPIYMSVCELTGIGEDLLESLRDVIYFSFSAIATILFGIFVFAYNSHMKKVKAAVEAE